MVCEWKLRRNCSFSPLQLAAVFASMCVVSLVIAGLFWLAGAPFVLLFAGLEMCALGVAFLVYARHAGDGERVRLAEGALWVERQNGGQQRLERFNPQWVRVDTAELETHAIRLGESGRAVEVGRYVTAQQRAAFVKELKSALRR